jgi:hypothetical protein
MTRNYGREETAPSFFFVYYEQKPDINRKFELKHVDYDLQLGRIARSLHSLQLCRNLWVKNICQLSDKIESFHYFVRA